MAEFKESPSQTAGPYVHIGCTPSTAGLERRGMGPQLGETMVDPVISGESITLSIRVLDGAGDPVSDALIEIWQPSPAGHFEPTEGFSNWGRRAADLDTGVAQFTTLKPGAPTGQAPHILVWIVARGINLALTTRIYFPDEDNQFDPLIQAAGPRAATLIAKQLNDGYAHDIHLQGPVETVFLDV